MPGGLTSAEASRRAHEVGANSLPRAERPSPARRFARQFVHFFALMLWCAAALALLAGLLPLALAITCVIVLNGLFAFI